MYIKYSNRYLMVLNWKKIMQPRAKKIKFSSRTDIFRDLKIKSMSILKYFKQKNNKSSRATKPAKDVSIRWLKAYYLY